jgi:hypothetical protein
MGTMTQSDSRVHLTTGWEPTTLLSDTLMHRFVHAYAGSLWEPVERMGGRVVHDSRFVVHDLRRPAAFENGVTLLAPLRADGTAVMDAVDGHLEGGTGRVWLWSAWPTPDLGRRGWQLSGHPPVLVRPAGPPPPSPDSDVEVVEVEDQSALDAWQDVVIRGYPLDGLQDTSGVSKRYLDDRVLDPGTHRLWLGILDGRPVAAGAAHITAGMNVFAMGATLPAARGRGAWNALAARRLAACTQLPAASLFSDDSRPLAERLGFVPLHRWTLWTRQRS